MNDETNTETETIDPRAAEITPARRMQIALNSNPVGESDEARRARADDIARELFEMRARAAREIDPRATDLEMRAEAFRYSNLLTGSEDPYLRMWTPDRKGYGPGRGREALEHMRRFVLSGEDRRFTKRYRDYYAKDQAGRRAEALENRKTLDALRRGVGEAVSYLTKDRPDNSISAPLSGAEMEMDVPEDVRRANETLVDSSGHWIGGEPDAELVSASDAVRKFRGGDAYRAAERERYEAQVQRDYEAELSRENAWNEISLTLGALAKKGETDAYDCVRAVMESPDNRLPETHVAKFMGLSDEMKRAVVRTRTILKPEVKGGFANAIEDAAIGAANVALGVVSAPFSQANKALMVNAGIDVNEVAKRRQYLYQATGDFSARGHEKDMPQMQFEAVCEEHGLVGDAVIGAVSTLPYMAAAAVPYAGPALVALEAMNEMDDHVAMNGGDISDPNYVVSSAVFAGLYAYTERLQVEGLLGDVADKEVRLALLKGLWGGIRNGKVLRHAVVGTVSESVQEGLQNGIMEVNNALALDQDPVRAFAEGFTQDFVGSLGTMLVVEAGGIVVGHAKRSGFANPLTAEGRAAGREARSADLEETVNQFAALQEMVTAENRGDLFKTNEELGRLSKIWTKGGAEALEREGGLAAEQARDAANLFSELREAGRTVGEADEATPDDMSDERAERFGKLSEDYVSGRSEAAPTEGDLAGFGFTESGAKAWLRWAGHERNVRLQIRALVEGGMIDRAYAARHAGAGAMAGDLLRVRRSMEELDFLRRIWADASKGVRMVSKDGRTISDPGARALEEQGFTKEAADRLSLLFHRERAAAYSKAALDGVRALYDAKTRGKVDARAAMAARFGGRFQRIRTGTDERGNATWGDFIAFTAKDGSTSLVEFTESATGAPDFSRADASAAESIAQATGNVVTAETWMNATPEERARIWNERGLRSEGDFVAAEHPVELSVPGDPRARVSSTQAARIVGRITVASESAGAERRDGLKTGFQAVIDNSAAFHETFHAFSHFAETSGLWSEEDLKHLRERFGDPAKGVRERFNEETGAEAFRAFNVRRMDGALTEEDQRGPFMKLASLAHGLLRASEEAAAKSRRARTAEDALFDQIMLDRYSSVPDFGAEEERRKAEEAKRRADEEGRKAPPPRTASPAKDGAAPETKTGNAPADGNDGSAGGSPADANRKAGSGNGTPAPANGKAGSGNGTPAPANGAPKRWTAYTPTGNVKVSGHWRVFDLKELVHSNNPLYRLYMRAQLRDRKDNKAEEDTRNEIVNNFQGERLLDAPDTANGAPIVFMAPDENGVVRPFVLSGNGRVLVLNELEARHLFDRYRETMKRWCAENGVSVPEGETPVLVRVVDDLGGESRERVADLSNTNSIQQYNEEEQARADAEVVRAGNLARLYVANEDGTPNMNGANDEFFSRFVAAVGDTSLYNSDRTLTQKAVQRAQRALMAVACGQGTRGRDVVKKLVERSETLGIRRQKNAVAIMAAPVAASEAKPEYAVGPDVSRAVSDFMDFTERKAAGKVGTIGDYMAEQDMLEPRSEVADGILGLLASPRAAAEIAAYVKTYCDAAAKEDPSGGLFGAARTKNEIWRDAVKTVDERLEKEKAQSERRRLSVAAARHDELMRSSAEYRDVYDRYHDADGSAKPGWLKAPNGRDTNLEPYQWVQVRTPSFMRWFGDWMAAAEMAPSSMDDAKVHFKRLMASKAELRTADGNVLRFASQSAKAYSKAAEVESANRQAHWCAIANIEQFVVRSRFMYEEKPRNGSSDILSYVKYGCVFTFGGDRYLAKITSKKYPGREQQNFYTVESVSVKKIVARGIHEAISKGQPLDANDESRIARILEGVNADSSKIVDENGEPLVVYHGTPNGEFFEFDRSKIGSSTDHGIWGRGFYFSSQKYIAEGYSRRGYGIPALMECFLNMRNPMPRSEITAIHKSVGDRLEADDSLDPNLHYSRFVEESQREIDESVRKHGYDGVISKSRNDVEYVVLSSVQIKSATDNTGAFDAANPDIRFSVRRVTPEEDAAYMDAVRRGDMETARTLLKEAWERSGYSPDTSYKDAHAAPSAPVEAKDFKNVDALEEARDEGWDLNLWAIAKGITGQPDDFFDKRGPSLYGYDDAAGRETQLAISQAIADIRGGNDKTRVIVYRAVPKNVKFDGLQSGGQWVSPSKTYAENHGKSRFGYGEYRIVREVVHAENLWWDGNDAREWGYDDGLQYVYMNAENGMKLATVTYDDAGNVIPLSQRFNQQKSDIRFSIAARLDEERRRIEAAGGRLLLAHHGTDSRGFTMFDRTDDVGYFFAKTRNTAASYIRKGNREDENEPGLPRMKDVEEYLKDEASGYSEEEVSKMSYPEKIEAYIEGTDARSGIYDVALKMENPYEIDCHGANWDAIYDVDENPETRTYDHVNVSFDAISGELKLRTREYGEDEENVETFDNLNDFFRAFKEKFGSEFGTDLEEIEKAYSDEEDFDSDIVDGRPEKGAYGALFTYNNYDESGWFLEPKRTRDIVAEAKDMGCDGVIFHNVEDNGGGVREATVDDVYVVMDPEQVKLVDDMTYDDDGSIVPAEKRLDWSNPDMRFSISNLYTGSAADYEKPSLHYVGTGEGNQVYGWGLYASDRRGVAEVYANSDAKRRASTPDEMWPKYKGKFDSELEHDPVRTFALKYVAREGSVDAAIQFLRTDDWTERAAPKAREAAEWLEKNRDDVTPPQTPSEHLYEQTWFTDRAPGDESHLLSWYEPVSEEQKAWIEEQAKKEGFVVGYSIGGEKYIAGPNVGGLAASESGIMPEYWRTGEDAYRAIGRLLGSPKAASEFLARAGIDGVKYPVDSYGGKEVKDGDDAGWNYVSFRDDNIRIDHKWVDGQRRFSFAIGERWAANLTDALFVAADLSKAREMLAGRDWDKLSRDEKVKIKLATSWEKGADGKWRREVPDMPLPDMAKLKVANPLYSPMDQRTARANPEKADRYRPVRLEELFKKKDAAALELFGAYPWLRRQIVVYGADARLGNGMRGAVVADGSILISEDLRRTPYHVRSTLTHEIQHKIQEHEDHARGGSSAGGRVFLLRKYLDASKAAEAWYGKIKELVRAEDGKSVANDYESDYRIWRYHRLRYVAMKASDPRVKAATSRLESLPGWKEVESERKAFRAKYGHEPKFFLGSVFDAERYASGGAAEVYRHMAGEVEARAMQRRIGMTEAQRVANLLMEDSEDVARKDQVLLGDALGELEKAVQAESARFSVASPLVDAMRDRERRALGPREPRGASPYFSDAAGAMDFPVRALRTLKDEPESSVENAAARMGKSARGEIRKRAPIAVADNGDGTYTVVDGNATVWAAARGGLETVRAVVVGKNTGTRLGNSVYMVQDDASGCDLPVNGKMRLRTHGLDGLEGEAARERAYEQAEENVPLLKSIVNAVAARDGTEALFRSPNKAGPGTDPREVGKEVKKRRRVDEKARNDYKKGDGKPDYSRVVDLIGGTLVLKDTDAFDEAIGHLRQEAARQGASIAQVNKLNMEPGAKGYQDVKVSIRFANGGIGEVIVVGDYMNDAKFNRGGHIVYDASRVLENKKSDPEIEATFEKLDELSVAIYARGETAPDAESFASMKASASSSLTRLLPILGRKDLISSKDINTLKEALSEFHLAKPPSVDSYAMPARSFIQNDISNSFEEEKTKEILSESSLTVNGKSDIAKSFSSAFHHPDAMSDDEAAARRSIRAMIADGGEKEAKSALENYVAYFELSHGGVPRRRTLARMGLAMGMKTVSPDELLRKGASIAEQMRGTLIERAARNGDVSTTLALLKREKDMDAALDDLVAGAAGAGGTLTHKGVGRVNDIINRRVEQLMRDFSAASLADMEGETGLDIAAEILANDPNAFDGELKKAKGIDPDAAAETAEDQSRDGEGGDEEEGDGDGAGLTDRQKWEREQLRREAEAKVARFIADAKARAAERKAAADRLRQKRTAESGDSDGGGGASGGTGGDTPSRNPLGDAVSPGGTVRADFRTPREFAAFLRVWAADKFARTHGLTSLGKAEENRLFAEFYRICARRELNDLAQKLLAPKGARAWVNRRLQDLEKGVRPDTVERISADVFAFINKAAIRESRAELVKKFKNDLKERYFKGTQFDQFRQDADRRVTGWVEEAARYICRVCDLSRREINGEPSQLQKERAELRAIIDRRTEVYDESGKDVAQASVDDAETRKALWKLALLDKFGAMTSLMPGEILDLQDAAFRHLETQAADLEAKWKETRELQERIRGDLTAAVVAPNGRRYQEKGWLNGRLFDALNGLIRLRLRHLTRFAPEDARKKAEDSINEVLVMLGDGETLYARALQDDRAAFFAGLAEIFQKPGGGADNGRIKKYLARMEEPIPEELSKRLSNQGFAGTMTYGQMLQLLVSLEQRSFKDAVKENGREGQVDLIRNYVGVDEDGNPVRAFTAEDERFIAWLRAFYEAKRETISKVTERMVGQRVDSPDPLYCPVRRLMDDRARGLHSDPMPRWDPIAKVFSRRVENLRDFDETRSIVSMFFEASEESAKLVAWAERGSIIRNVFTSVGVQSAIQRAFGPGELGRILRQLEATFNGGESRQRTPGELAAVDKVMNFTTYAYLGFNPLSAMKQTTSFTVWANALPGGFKDLWRHMTHFDASVVRHLRESDEYKVRYGNDVGSGQDAATKGVYENPSLNPVARIFSGAGMWLLKKGDFVPGIWIAQGVYKDMLNRNLQRGMSYEEADRRAVTETFNMLEETQQSGRTYNTNALSIEHGRIGRLLTQFATSPLQQLQYETQAWREWRDMVRYGMGEKRIAEARGRFLRAVVINHVLIPAALELVISAYRLALGEEPPWEKEGAHWDFLVEILLGQFGRVFMLGAFAKTTLNAVFKRQAPRGGELLPSEGILGMAAKAGFMVHDFATCDGDRLQKDLEGIARGAAATRTTYNIVRRFRGDSDEVRKSEKAAKKAARGK